MAFRIFLDTNVFLDHFLDRDIHSTHILKACEQRRASAFASSASFYTLSYFLRKNSSFSETKKFLSEYLRFVSVLPAYKSNLLVSLESSFSDLEDAFQYYSALQQESLDFFITNNLKDFRKAYQQLPVISPKKFFTDHLR